MKSHILAPLYLMLKILVFSCGAGMESFTWLLSMVILALSALSWYMLVCISTVEATKSGTWTPISVTNSTPTEGMKDSSFCKHKTHTIEPFLIYCSCHFY